MSVLSYITTELDAVAWLTVGFFDYNDVAVIAKLNILPSLVIDCFHARLTQLL